MGAVVCCCCCVLTSRCQRNNVVEVTKVDASIDEYALYRERVDDGTLLRIIGLDLLTADDDIG